MQSGAHAPLKTNTSAAAIAATLNARHNFPTNFVLANSSAGPLAASGGRVATLSPYNIRNASVEGSIQLQARDFVLHQQLATFQCHDLKIVDRWMGPRFVDFRLEGPMTSF